MKRRFGKTKRVSRDNTQLVLKCFQQSLLHFVRNRRGGMARKRMILGDLSITFTFKLAESRRDTDRPAALRVFNNGEEEGERERERDLSHLRQRQPRHLGQAAAANLSHCNCNSATEVIRPVSPLFFSFTRAA